MLTIERVKRARNPREVLRYVRRRISQARNKGFVNPNSTSFARDARRGSTAELFDVIKGIRGWFTYDDAAHFTLVLNMQTTLGLHGDILEIGTFHGRSTCLLAYCLQQKEVLTVCDPFQSGDVYVSAAPSQSMLREHILRVLPGFDLTAIEICPVYSVDLDLHVARRFRFVHVDGSHDYTDVLHDLRLARRHLVRGGVIAVDDFDHPDWPGVYLAVAAFRAEHPEMVEVADLNRQSESGRKLYLSLSSFRDGNCSA